MINHKIENTLDFEQPPLPVEREVSETLLSPETLDLVAGMGNHEAKLLLMVHLSNKSDFSRAHELGKSYDSFLGENAKWKPSPMMASNYCRQSLEPIGQVVQGDVKGLRGPTVGYKLSETGQRLGVPLAGLLLQWSLDYPQLSVQRILGPSNSKGDTRAPHNRIRALLELLSADDRGLSTAEIANTTGLKFGTNEYHTAISNIDGATRALEADGLLASERTISDKQEDSLVIVDDAYPEHPAGSERSEVVESIYLLMQRLKGAGINTFTYDQGLTFVTEQIATADANLDKAEIRRLYREAIYATNSSRPGNPYKVIPGLKRVEAPKDGTFTRFKVSADGREALEALANIVLDIDNPDEALLARGNEAAQSIAHDGQSKTLLINKAYEFSAAAKKTPLEETAVQIISILRNAGEPVSGPALHKRFVSETGRNLSQSTLQVLARKLGSKELIVIDGRRGDASRKRSHNFYSLPNDS